MNRYDLVTFDMGYTLIYFHPSIDDVELCAYRAVGLRPERAALAAARQAVWDEYGTQVAGCTYEPTQERSWALEEQMTGRILDRLGLNRAVLPHLLLALEAAYDTPGVIRPYPETLAVLAELQARGLRLGVISNWSWELERRAALVGLDAYFHFMIASAQAGCDKPHPDIFRQALRAAGVAPERALHIGDSYEADVLGARGVGMDALWLDRKGQGGHTDCRAIRDLTEVLAILTAQ